MEAEGDGEVQVRTDSRVRDGGTGVGDGVELRRENLLVCEDVISLEVARVS